MSKTFTPRYLKPKTGHACEEEFRDPKIREEYEEYLDRLADEFDYVKSLEMDNINIKSTV